MSAVGVWLGCTYRRRWHLALAWLAAAVTQWYLAGELSRLVGHVQLVATTQAAERDAATLRREAESVSIGALVGVITRALELVDRLCWYSLAQGDASTFCCQAAVGAELCEFGMCAGLIEEEEVYE